MKTMIVTVGPTSHLVHLLHNLPQKLVILNLQ